MASKDDQQLSELLSRLQIALKNIRLYPSGHDVVQARTGAAHTFLVQLLAKKKVLLFGVARDTITYGGQSIGEQVAACTAFAKILSRHDIASVTFSLGVSQHSLFSFLKAIGVPPEHKQTDKTLQEELNSQQVSHIEIETVNYNYFDRLHGKDGSAKQNSRLTWLTFAKKLTSGNLSSLGDSLEQGIGIGGDTTAPEALAAAINAQADKQPEIIQEFSLLLDEMLKNPQEQSSPSSFGGRELNTILTSLNPKLREQFLQTTIKCCDQNQQQTDPEEIFENFSDTLVLDMMQQVNQKGVAVSPALLQLINKLSQIRFTPESTPVPNLSEEQVSSTLESRKYQQFVGKDYHDTLERLSTTDASAKNAAPEGFSIGLHLPSMEEEHLNSQLVQAILIFMEDAEDEEYKQLAEKLMSFTFQLPESGAYNLLHIIAETLVRHQTEKNSATSRDTAKNCLQELTAPDFLDYIHISLKEATEQKIKEATAFLLILGPAILKRLLKRFSMQRTISENDPLVTIFKAHRVKTLTLIFTAIPKEKVTVILRLLTLVSYLGTDGLARILHTLLDHYDSEVRTRAMDLLLPLHDETAIKRLQSQLTSKDDQVVDAAIELCSLHNVPQCTSELIKLLTPHLLKKSGVERNRKLLIILGKIGNKQALPVIEEIAMAKWMFNQELITNMKQVLYYSLKGYRPEDRMKLVKLGLNSPDEKIRHICSSL